LGAMLGPDREDALWVLEQDGRTVGGLGLHPAGAPGVATLGMAVLAEVRGHGGGRALLRAALDHAEGAGLHKVELEVFPDNGVAVALYAAHGFEVEGLRRRHYLRRDGTRRDVLLMARLFGIEPTAGPPQRSA
ncbi:MAG: GNAT family N-acetyltransferase, partial [Solirubrobacteraceae bacterium]